MLSNNVEMHTNFNKMSAGSWGGSPERCWGKWVVWREETPASE